jgi:hypothetical protein
MSHNDTSFDSATFSSAIAPEYGIHDAEQLKINIEADVRMLQLKSQPVSRDRSGYNYHP